METVEIIANKIKNGECDPDGDAVYLIRNGRILSNGQHRMHAVVKAGVPALIVVKYAKINKHRDYPIFCVNVKTYR